MMSKENEQAMIATEAVNLAKSLPFTLIQILAKSIKEIVLSDWPASRARVLQNVSHPYYRILAAKFLDDWRPLAEEIYLRTQSLALLTAASGEKEHPEHQSH